MIGNCDFIKAIKIQYPQKRVSFRHTGIQINRGIGCSGCHSKCITLKAAWVFPDGGVTPCPQEINSKKIYPQNSGEWIKAMEYIKKFHTISQKVNAYLSVS